MNLMQMVTSWTPAAGYKTSDGVPKPSDTVHVWYSDSVQDVGICYAVVSEGQENVGFYVELCSGYHLSSKVDVISAEYFLRQLKAQELVAAKVDVNVYFDGKVTSMPFTVADGKNATIGLVHEGTYEFPNDQHEHITITSGTAKVNDTELGEGDFIEIEAGAGVKFEAVGGTVAYCCIYG